ncbi:MAG: PDZ domain-containing protein [Microbacterium sp.]|uniref:YlbL family protein n=1 Tax=Microbacterium sp. TaxID=51671 RepID=UPI0039E2AD98
MSLFDDVDETAPARPRMSRRTRIGAVSLIVALVALLALSLLPSSFVIETPGPVYNTLGTTTDADGDEVPVISVDGAQTYDTAGQLDLLTVQVTGTPEQPPSWLEVVAAWFDATKAVVPMESVYSTGQSSDERNAQNAAEMTDSQTEAEAAAFTSLGYDLDPVVGVYSVQDDGAAAGVLVAGDEILAVDGTAVSSVDDLRAAVAAGAGAPVTLLVSRDGAEQELQVAPAAGDDGTWLLGITVQMSYDMPYDVTFGLSNVGGPSAGMMFALGIIDQLTPGELNGGEAVAGTGTISADGTVGAIGGIRQKMWGAVEAGAEYFLAPASNCDDVVGYVPTGLRVFAVSTLDDSLTVLQTIADGGDLDALPTCTAS